MLLSGILVLTLFHDPGDGLICGPSPSHDGVVLITGTALELHPVSFRKLSIPDFLT